MATTPMMRQYLEAKRQCPDALLLFRMGDFYEMFFEDARTAARVLGLALTSREKGPDAVPMAGFPHHSLETHLVTLVEAGYRVAICDQVEDPRLARGLVRREVTRVVTAGTLIEEGLLQPQTNNFLAALSVGPAACGLAWVDISTGDFQLCDLPSADLGDELDRIEPAECLVSDELERQSLPPALAGRSRMMITSRPGWNFHRSHAVQVLRRLLGVATLEGFGVDESWLSVGAAGAIIEYLGQTQRSSLDHIVRLVPYERSRRMVIDAVTRRSLELVRTLREGRRDGSLLAVLDETATPMGARLLAQWVANPLVDPDQIGRRHEAVEELCGQNLLRRELAELLGRCYDLERLTSRIATRRASPRDLSFLTRTLGLLPKLKAKLTGRHCDLLRQLEGDLDLCVELRQRLERALVDNPPPSAADGGIIRPGYSPELDELHRIRQGGKKWMAEFQAAEIQRTRIPTLKVGFNRVFGYYIEVTHAHANKVPPDYVRKQTLKNAERYITPQLKEYEQKVLRAEERAVELELELFGELREEAARHTRRLQQTARALAALDTLLSLASVAVRRNYCRPTMTEEPVIEVRDGRHPVIEVLGAEAGFVPNDIEMSPHQARMLVVTGPNMAGKSTYIRQAALIVIMAQIGSFVPARSARIGMADRLFARVGASDELARGQSTFMVEMVETAAILNRATERSLVIVDEIGRGTSTYDGVSLAWAVAERLHDHNRCRTLFATHYHELAELARSLDGVRNLNVAVREWEDQVIFLHKIVEGSADKSYGIHVARLAGVPRQVIERAKTILAELEAQHLGPEGEPRLARSGQRPRRRSSFIQRSLFWGRYDHLIEAIRRWDLDGLSPEEALARLREIRRQLDAN